MKLYIDPAVVPFQGEEQYRNRLSGLLRDAERRFYGFEVCLDGSPPPTLLSAAESLVKDRFDAWVRSECLGEGRT